MVTTPLKEETTDETIKPGAVGRSQSETKRN